MNFQNIRFRSCHFLPQDDYAARNDYTNNSETILLCNRCVCVIGKLIPRQLMCVIGAFTENTFIGARITQNSSCQKAMCNRCPVQLGNYIPNNKNVCVIILGPSAHSGQNITWNAKIWGELLRSCNSLYDLRDLPKTMFPSCSFLVVSS